MGASAPDYDEYQSSFHEGFRSELSVIVDGLTIPEGGFVLDVPCGNGFYSRMLADRLKSGERLSLVDSNEEYLAQARLAVAGAPGRIETLKAGACRLPFEDATFHLVWCAQSLISLQPGRVVKEMLRVTCGGGVVAIVEVDEFHHVILPWPAELEAAIPEAVRAASVEKFGDGEKLAPSRKLRGILGDAGFASIKRTTYAFDRVAPFDERTSTFLSRYFDHLRAFAYPHLSRSARAMFDNAVDPEADDSLLRRRDVEMACINVVYQARPSQSPQRECD